MKKILIFTVFMTMLPFLVFAGVISDLATEGLLYLASTSPIIGMIAVVLGGLMFILELFFEAKGKQPGEEKWNKLKTGYFGPFIMFCINAFKSKLPKK